MELEKRTMCVHTQQMQTTARLVPYQPIPLTVSSNLAASTSVAPGAPQPSPSTTSSTASAASAASQCQSHHSNSATPIPNSRDSLSNCNLFSKSLFLLVQSRKNAFESRQSRYRSIGLDKEIGERRSGMSFR